ncbi:enoyl-CoA hydratase/isomerase family protein [Noviherbaspirillum massiliense]|uniref:enoyl-CoA hydratase/isomerase family protein n=1 Tax=Noviherbaspirillum massiliense TaxID=1465823 RepID=UPI0002EDA6E1|nr:enoyl-CoA hydratase/isomerase family protein [Noviherbaspirillum massiliense]
MTEFIRTAIKGRTGFITLDRPKALNSLSLDMVRALTACLLAWRDEPKLAAVVIHSSSEKAFCAGGDIRFFYEAGRSTPLDGSALLEDFFTEEYALNHLIRYYPKPYIAVMDGIVMGGGMGIAQGNPANCLRIVTERTKMAMPEVNIGLFPDVGGSYFLSRAPGQIGAYLGVTGEIIAAADALHAGLADVFLPSAQLPALMDLLASDGAADLHKAALDFSASFQSQADPANSVLAANRSLIDSCFDHDSVQSIIDALRHSDSSFAQKTLATMSKRSPLMMCVTLSQIRRGAGMTVAECLRMERNLVRRVFEHGEVLEGVRSVVIDKDNAPQWNPATLNEVSPQMVERFFEPAWPAYAHPLRDLS